MKTYYETIYWNISPDGEIIDVDYATILKDYKVIHRETTFKYKENKKITTVLRIIKPKEQLKLKFDGNT